MKPVRKITNRSPHKLIGRFPSRKSPNCIWWESQLERDCLFHLELDSSVTAISGQPFRVSYVLDGKRHRYTPDFLAEGKDRRDVIEVKPLAKTLTPEFGNWKAAVEKVLQKHGYHFVIKTEEQLRKQPELFNLKRLYRYLETTATPLQLRQLIAAIKRGANTVEAAQAQCRLKNIEVEAVWHLIATRTVHVDLSKVLSPQSATTMRSHTTCH